MGNRYAQPIAPDAQAPEAASRPNRYATPLPAAPEAAPATTMLQPESTTPDKYQQRAAQYLDDLEAQGKVSTGGGLNTFLHGATAGIGNRFIAGAHAIAGQALAHDNVPFMDRIRYEVALEQEKYRRASQGTGGTIGEMAGAIVNPINKFGGGSLASSVGTGAAMGATEGLMDTGTLKGAESGGVLGGVGGGVGYGLGKVVGKIADATNPPTRVAPAQNADAIRTQAQNLYDQFENSGGRYTRAAVQDARLQSMRSLDDVGWVPGAHGQVDAIMNRMDKMSSGYGPTEIRPKDMQNLRSAAAGLTKSSDGQVRGYGYTLSNTMDDAIDNLTQHPGFMTGGGVDTNAFHEANRLYRQANKAQVLENNIDRGVRQAGVTYSGGNETNKILQAVNKTYNDLTKNGRKLTPDEEAAFRAVTNPGQGERALRSLAKMKLGGGAGANFLNLLGASTTGPAWAVVPAAAQVADMAANATARRNADEVSRIIRNGGVRKALTTPNPPNALQNAAGAIAPRLSGPFAQLLYSSMATPAPVKGKR